MLKFLQLFPDMQDDHFGVLTDEELGIIVRAAMDYAFNGVLPEFETRSVLGLTWRRMKSYIDQCGKTAEKNRENGSKGGKPTETQRNTVKPNVTQPNPAEPTQTQTNHYQDQDQDQDQDHKQDHKQEQEQEKKEDAPAPTGKLLAFDGSDLTADVQRSRDAEMLVAQYLPPSRTPIEYDPRVAEMAALIDKHGLEKVKGAIKTAVSSDNRGGISIAFLTAILDEKGAKKSRAAPTDYQARQYSASELKGMEVDIDALFDEVERSK